MKKICAPLLLVLSTFIFQISPAQTPDANLTAWNEINPIEKLYLHIDRDDYHAGQTLWFKGYFLSGYVPSAKSSTVYVELLNMQGALIQRGVFPAYMGSALGQLEIPENIPTGTYQIRAYSPLMLNQPGFVFNKQINVYGKETTKSTKKAMPSDNQLLFFPEGGNFITGLLNDVAFKALDKNGMPLQVSGEVKDEKGETITTFTTLHDGMGSFVINPLEGQSYFATIRGSDKQYALPAQTANGIVFTVKNTSKGKQFRIVQPDNGNEAFKPAYMVGQMENEVIFKQLFKPDKQEINGSIQIDNLYSGILHLTVFNKANMPLAERLVFVDNKNYMLPALLKIDTLNTEERKRNHFTISLTDTIIGNFSVSVTDADFDGTDNRPVNICSWFLLSSDIKGYVNNPAYYFSSTADSVRNALDLVMRTNGWTRFKWTDAVQNKLPAPLYKDSGYITLAGKINIEGTRKPLADRDVIMIMSEEDTSQGRRGFPKFIHTDSSGGFKIDSMLFYNKMRILFSDVRGNKSKFIRVKLDIDSLHRRYPIESNILPLADTTNTALDTKMNAVYNDYMKAQGTTLANVTVRARQKSEQEKLDDQYASALFSNNFNARILDLRNENYGGGDIFQYLQGRLPGLQINGSPGNYVLNYRGGGFNGGNVSLFLDEMPADADMVSSVPISEIAYVKLLPNSIASIGGGTALAIYRKKGADLTATIESPTDIVIYNGYTIVKEFYNPDYDKKPDDKADTRLTLYWNPNIFLAHVNPQVSIIFYNNDRTKRFKIVAEGITSDGRMLMLEKIIEPGK